MLSKEFSFELITQDNKARLGKIHTPRGIIDTPAFMPVGTQGTVKGVFTDDILKTNTQIILGNTYHLLLRPGIKILEKFIGLHCSVFKPVLKIKENKAYIYFDQSFISENLSNNGLLFSILGFASLIKDLLKSDIKIQANFTQVDVFYSSNINQLLGFESHFSQESNCLIFDKAFLTNQLPTADEMVFRLLKEQCERDVKRQIIKKEKLNSTKILVKELLHGSL